MKKERWMFFYVVLVVTSVGLTLVRDQVAGSQTVKHIYHLLFNILGQLQRNSWRSGHFVRGFLVEPWNGTFTCVGNVRTATIWWQRSLNRSSFVILFTFVCPHAGISIESPDQSHLNSFVTCHRGGFQTGRCQTGFQDEQSKLCPVQVNTLLHWTAER